MRKRVTCTCTPSGNDGIISCSTMRFEDGMIRPTRIVMGYTPLISTIVCRLPRVCGATEQIRAFFRIDGIGGILTRPLVSDRQEAPLGKPCLQDLRERMTAA